jgi:hypothetical protein
MKQFDKKVRWNFKLAISGYGQNCEEALRDALLTATFEIEDWVHDDSIEAIENHEVSLIDEDEFIRE